MKMESSADRRKNQKMKHIEKCSSVGISNSSNHVDIVNARGKRSHECSSSTKMKWQKVSASSSRLRTDLDVSQPTHVMSLAKRGHEGVTPTSAHNPLTILSWLIDNNMILPRAKVHYCRARGSVPMARGKVCREGIICNCCQEVFTLRDFESHAVSSESYAGCSNHIPAANIFLVNGKSLLDCQKLLITQMICCPEQPDAMTRENDNICTVCKDGGDLILCDLCPSAFHMSCTGLKDLPDGDWFCAACCCGICGRSILEKDREPTSHYQRCCQCEHKYHTGCLRERSTAMLESDPKGNWFCSENCMKIYIGLHERLGKQFPVGFDNLTWSLLKPMKSDSDDTNEPDNDAITENSCRLNLALCVMHQCFNRVKELHTGRDLAEDIIFSRGSDLDHINFQGFYTVLLERNDELITVATIRIYGGKVAEVPFLGTRFQYRRSGNCGVMLDLLEKMLIDFGVEILVLHAIPSSLKKWTKTFGFSKMKDSERLQLLDYRFMDFYDSIMCQKRLLSTLKAENLPLKGILHDVSGTSDQIMCQKRLLSTPKAENLPLKGILHDVSGSGDNINLEGILHDVSGSGDHINLAEILNDVPGSDDHINLAGISGIFTEHAAQGDRGYKPSLNMEFLKAQDPSSAARNATGSRLPACIEVIDCNTDSGDTKSLEVTDTSVAALLGTVSEHLTPYQDTESSEQVFMDISDSSTDPPLVKEIDNVCSTSASDLLDFRGLAKVKKDFLPLLEEACSFYPSLIESQMMNTPRFRGWAFTTLGEVLHFLETKKAKDMTADVSHDLELLWFDLQSFRFDLSWLWPRVERALGMKKILERAMATQLKKLRENVDALEAKLVDARSSLKQAEEDEKILASKL